MSIRFPFILCAFINQSINQFVPSPPFPNKQTLCHLSLGSNSNNNNNSNNGNNWNFDSSSNAQNNGKRFNPKDPKDVMQKLYGEYNPQSPNCRFEVILYNRVPPNQVGNFRLQKPVNVRPQLWDQFVANNPDKTHLAPTAIRGYHDLDIRSKLCFSGHCKMIKSYELIAERVDALKMDIEKRMKDQILELKQIQMDLSYRLLVVIKAYILKSLQTQREQQGQVIEAALNVNERRMQEMLEGLVGEARELQYKMAHADRLMAEVGSGMSMAVTETRTVDEEAMFDQKSMNAMFNCLTDDTKIISYLAKTVQKDYDDLEIMRSGLEPQKRLIL